MEGWTAPHIKLAADRYEEHLQKEPTPHGRRTLISKPWINELLTEFEGRNTGFHECFGLAFLLSSARSSVGSGRSEFKPDRGPKTEVDGSSPLGPRQLRECHQSSTPRYPAVHPSLKNPRAMLDGDPSLIESIAPASQRSTGKIARIERSGS